MKIKLAIAVVFSCLTIGTYAMPTVYGALDVSIDQASEKRNDEKSVDKTYVNSNSSFIGLKGNLDLNDRLSAIYQIDWTLYADGDNTDFANRTRYVGLKDQYLGTIKIGQQDTAVKTLSGAVDVFNSRSSGKLDVESIMLGENRLSNAVIYETPKTRVGNGDLVFTGVFATGEGNKRTTNQRGTNYVSTRGFSDSLSGSAVYSNANFLVGIGYDRAIPSQFASKKAVNGTPASILATANTVRVVGRAKVQNLVLKGLYQHSKAVDKKLVNASNAEYLPSINKSTLNKAQGWLVGAEYTIPSTLVTVKASYSENLTDFRATNDFKAQQIAAGVDYSFNKQVKAYGQVGQVQYKQGTSKEKARLGGVGMEYKF